jgi:hypothetical protein
MAPTTGAASVAPRPSRGGTNRPTPLPVAVTGPAGRPSAEPAAGAANDEGAAGAAAEDAGGGDEVDSGDAADDGSAADAGADGAAKGARRRRRLRTARRLRRLRQAGPAAAFPPAAKPADSSEGFEAAGDGATFTVADPRPPTAELNVTAPKWAAPGAKVQVDFGATSYVGASVAGGDVTVEWETPQAKGEAKVGGGAWGRRRLSRAVAMGARGHARPALV